jgi:hypothetical protein
MFLKSSLSLPQTSGFVAFDSGGACEAEVRRKAANPPAVVAAPQPEPEPEPELLRAAEPALEIAEGWHESPTWEPPTSRWVRRVEAAVIVALGGYFVLGLAGIAGWP